MVVSQLVVVETGDGKSVGLAEEDSEDGHRADGGSDLLVNALDAFEARIRATVPLDTLPTGTPVGEVKLRVEEAEHECRLKVYEVMQVTGRGIRSIAGASGDDEEASPAEAGVATESAAQPDATVGPTAEEGSTEGDWTAAAVGLAMLFSPTR